MKPSRTRRTALGYAVAQMGTVALAAWLGQRYQIASLIVTAVALLPTLPGAWMTWVAYRADRLEGVDMDAKALTLADAVLKGETVQRARLIGDGAHRIDLTFQYIAAQANNAAGAAPHGRMSDVVAYYMALKPARLVITGEPGAGKTLLATDLIIGLLNDPARTASDPVPIRFSVANWNTEVPFADWLIAQIHQRFHDRGLTITDVTTLVEQHRILPVLDGLDEMDSEATQIPSRRAAKALQQLNAYPHPAGSAPTVLTCRTAQYTELSTVDIRLREAARIHIEPVSTGQAQKYLNARSMNPARWAPVIDLLRNAPGGTLARSLNTPWRLNLAVTAYEERNPDNLAYCRNPQDMQTLSSPSAVRDHLLSLYLPAAVRQHPNRPDLYGVNRTHQCLSGLADILKNSSPAEAGPRTDLILHQLWQSAPRHIRHLDIAFAIDFLGFLALIAFLCTGTPLATTGAMVVSPFIIWLSARRAIADPVSFQLHRLRNSIGRRRIIRKLAGPFLLAIAPGFAFAAIIAAEFELLLHTGLKRTISFGTPFAAIDLWIALSLGITVALTAPLDDSAHADPRAPIRSSLILTLLGGLSVGIGFALTYPFYAEVNAILDAKGIFGALPLTEVDHATLATLVVIGWAAGIYIFGGVARRYLIFLYTFRRISPWRLGVFLHWAYEAGLLRISGLAYQFRHREFQEWLSNNPNLEHE